MQFVRVHRLALENYRNYHAVQCHLNPDLPTIFLGDNGAGKTNILEAISLIAPGRGLRNAPSVEKIRHGAPDFRIRFDVSANHDPLVIKIHWDTQTQKPIVFFDEEAVKLQDRKLPIVWMTPRMNRLFLEPSSERRRFYDRLVSAFDPSHLGRLQALENALRERRNILQMPKIDASWLGIIESQIAAKSVAIAAFRKDFLGRLNQALTHHVDFLPSVSLQLIGYLEEQLTSQSALDVEEQYRQYLAQNRQNESVESPMKSDFQAFYHKKNCNAEICSTGEQKMMVLAIIFAQISLILAQNGIQPIILFDEITAHLDESRRHQLCDLLANLKLPCFITATEINYFKSFAKQYQFIQIDDNQLKIITP